jgi:hypothetical protein
MGLESAFQYVGLFALNLSLFAVLLAILPFDLSKWVEHYRAKSFKLSFVWFVGIHIFTLLFYTGAMYEVVRDGGSFGGWDTRTASLIWGLLASACGTIWIPFWLIPVDRGNHYSTSHIQVLSVIFSWGAFIWWLNFTRSAWFVLPWAIWETFIFFVVWIFEERHFVVQYIGKEE